MTTRATTTATTTATAGAAGDGGHDGRRRRLPLLGVVVALVVVAGLLLVLRGPGEPAGPTGRSVVAAVLADEPEAPVVLPVDLPRGYVLDRGDTAGGAQGETPLAAWVFRPVQEESGLAVVQLCVAARQRCAASAEGLLARQVDGRDVSVVPFGPQAESARALDVWRDVPLTGDWESLGWLDAVLVPDGPPPGRD